MSRPRYYRLNPDHSVEPLEGTHALRDWAEAFEDFDGRRVAWTQVAPGIEVSTVFLGLDHNHWGKGPPLLFETMTFDDYGGGEQWRWSTWEEAATGHEAAVSILRAKLVKRMAVDILGKPKP